MHTEELNKTKSCAEIAEEMNTTRQNINQTLKRALEKFYDKALYKYKLSERPYEILSIMIDQFNISSKEDVDEFYKILPERIKEEVQNDIKENGTANV